MHRKVASRVERTSLSTDAIVTGLEDVGPSSRLRWINQGAYIRKVAQLMAPCIIKRALPDMFSPAARLS